MKTQTITRTTEKDAKLKDAIGETLFNQLEQQIKTIEEKSKMETQNKKKQRSEEIKKIIETIKKKWKKVNGVNIEDITKEIIKQIEGEK